MVKKIIETAKRGMIREWITPALAIVILVYVVQITNYLKGLDARALTSVEMRVRLEDHMDAWTPVRQENAFKRLKGVEDTAIQNKAADSLMKLEIKEIKAMLKTIVENQELLIKL